MIRLAAILLCLVLFIPGTAQANYAYNAFPQLAPFSFPIAIEDPRDGTDRLFVVERAGRVHVFQNDPTVTQRALFLDIADSVVTSTEGGLLDIAFHPQYEVNRQFYVVYTRDNPRRWILARFTTSATDPASAPRSTELRLIDIPKVNLFHNGGCLAFGPDGYLYVSLGDDGNTAIQNAQNLQVLFGKILRIDVDHPANGKPYGIPPDNPFAGSPNGERAEIWAFGFRNPWQFSFDPPTGRMWVGDVGDDDWEEIDIVKKGRNYGWPRLEGNMCFYPAVCDTVGLNLVAPLFVYPHAPLGSVTGGFVYRGSANPAWVGKYIYGDFMTEQVYALTWDGVNPPTNQALKTLFRFASFGVDKDGEFFMPSFNGGGIYRLFYSTTGVDTPALPGALISVSPNPFQSSTAIAFTMPGEAHVTLEIFDIAGRRVATLIDRRMGSGAQSVRWDGRGDGGAMQPSGVYVGRLAVDGRSVATQRMVFLK
ncbi:MAG TPA: PQQ-dependent sugar dehydrogenase [Gemmatimonadaceae bacterium]